MWRSALIYGGIGASVFLGYNIYKSANSLSPLNTSYLPSEDSFILYKLSSTSNLEKKLLSLKIPVFSFNDWSKFNKDKVEDYESSTGVYFVKKIKEKYVSNSLESPGKLEKWLKIHENAFEEISSKKELEKLMKNRKKHEFLDSIVAAYVPENDKNREKIYQDLITEVNFGQPMCSVLASYAQPFLKFVKITDKALAEELKIDSLDKLTIVKIRDCRDWFNGPKSKFSYVEPSTFKSFTENYLKKSFKINGHELQLELKIFFDYFTLNNTDPNSENYLSDLKTISEEISYVNPSIVPLFTLKELQLTSPKIFFTLQNENSKLLVISLKKDHEERNLNELNKIFLGLKIEEFARNHPEVLIVIGYPEFIYHLPIKDLSIFHYEPVEIRLMDVKKGQVVNSLFLDESMSLEDLMNDKQIRLETRPPSTPQHAEILSPEELYDHVLKHENRCFFVMNCSKTCPACSYQDTFFQEAAKNSEICKFAKYYVSNQSPYFKGPNSTPRYYLYLPGNKVPIEYDPRVYGIKPQDFLEFVNKHLENLNKN